MVDKFNVFDDSLDRIKNTTMSIQPQKEVHHNFTHL